MCKVSPLRNRPLFDLKTARRIAQSKNDASYSVIADLYQRLLKENEQTATRWSNHICETAVTIDWQFNAGAERGQCGRYAIYMDALVFPQLLICFRRLLSHPEVLPEIGEPPPHYNPPRLVLLTEKDIKLLGSGRVEDPDTMHESRELSCNFLILRTLIFIWMHELAHVTQGLVDYPARPSTEQRRGFEHLADLFAMRECIEAEQAFPRRDLLDPHRLRLWGFSISTFWRILDQVHVEAGHENSHPSPAMRELLFKAYVNTHFEHIDGIEDVIQGIEEASRAWDLVGWPSLQTIDECELNQAISDIAAADAVNAVQASPNSHQVFEPRPDPTL